jgi:hypothetical protein
MKSALTRIGRCGFIGCGQSLLLKMSSRVESTSMKIFCTSAEAMESLR